MMSEPSGELERVVVDAEIVPASTEIAVHEDWSLDKVQLTLVNTIDRAMEFKRWLGERRPVDAIGVDGETPSLNPYAGPPPRLFQFGDSRHGWAIPWDGWKGVVLEALESWEGGMVFHNAR